jgi:hypothetical protein
MAKIDKDKIIEIFKDWFRNELVISHKRNTEKLSKLKEFNVNPFLIYYLSNYLEGNSDSRNLAKALIYPRVLGTSITTSFGMRMQGFITKLLEDTAGSLIPGIDLEFIDQIDGRKKYCQLKSGPNVVNHDDVETIDKHFTSIKNLGKQNQADLKYGDLVFCLIYGEETELNSFIKNLQKRDITVYVGKEFWERFTGDHEFYKHLIQSAGEVANEFNMKDVVDSVIDQLSIDLEENFKGKLD